MTSIYKSIHIEGKWPYQYVKPEREVKNAKERERYWRKKAATVKTTDGKKLLNLPVREMTDNQFFESINHVYTR